MDLQFPIPEDAVCQDSADTLDQYGFKSIGGSASLDSARLICVADPNHAGNATLRGMLLQELMTGNDTFLHEGLATAEELERHKLETEAKTTSWEDPSLNALASLIVQRCLLLDMQLDSVSDATKRYRDNQDNQRGLKPHYEGKEQARQRLEKAADRIILGMRNEEMLKHIKAALDETPGKVYVEAGKDHFLQPELAQALDGLGVPYITITEEHGLPSTVNQNFAFDQGFYELDRPNLKRLWRSGSYQKTRLSPKTSLPVGPTERTRQP